MPSFKHLSVTELKTIMGSGEVTIVDIRDPRAFESGHIDGAFRLDNENAASFIASTDKDSPLVVCCYHGHSSQAAADFLCQQGFSDVYSLDGGFEGWRVASVVTDQ